MNGRRRAPRLDVRRTAPPMAAPPIASLVLADYLSALNGLWIGRGVRHRWRRSTGHLGPTWRVTRFRAAQGVEPLVHFVGLSPKLFQVGLERRGGRVWAQGEKGPAGRASRVPPSLRIRFKP